MGGTSGDSQISWLLGHLPQKFYYYSLSPNLWAGGGLLQTDFLTVMKSATKFLLLLSVTKSTNGGYFCRQISWLLGNLLQNITLCHQIYELGELLQTDFLTVMKSATQISLLLGNLPERFTPCEQCRRVILQTDFLTVSKSATNYYSLSPNL